MGPKYRPRKEHRGPGYKLTRKERAMYILWAPPFAYLGISVLVGLYQLLTTGHLQP